MANPNQVIIEIAAENRIDNELQDALQEMRDLEQQGGRTGRGFDDLARASQRASSFIERGYSVMTRLDLVQITVQQSQDRLTQSQDRLSAAQAKYGTSSAQAEAATRDLEAAQANMDKTNARAHLSYVLIAGDIVTLAAQLPKAVAGMRAMAAANAAAGASSIGLSAALGPVGLGVAAVTALVVAGTMAWKANSDQQDRNLSNMQRLRKEQEDLAAVARAARDDPGQNMFGGDYGRKKAEEAEARIRELQERERSGWIILAEEFFAAEQRKAQVAAGNEAAIRSELEKTRLEMDKIAAAMGMPADEAALQGLQERWQGLSAAAGDYEARLQTIAKTAEDAAKKQEDAAKKQQDALDASLRSLVQAVPGWENLSFAIQGSILAANGFDATANPALKRFNDLEKILAGQTAETKVAILEQEGATALKGETTEDFHARLRAMLGDEAYAKIQFDETGRSILTQADATNAASDAARNLASAQASLGGYGSSSTSGGGYAGGASAPSWANSDFAQRNMTTKDATRIEEIQSLLPSVSSLSDRNRLLGEMKGLQGGSPFVDAQGNERWDLRSLANTDAGVDVSGVARGVYAPRGGGFQNVGSIGSTDLNSAYGTRTLVSDNRGGMKYDGGSPQGAGGDVNMGGVTIIVNNPKNAQEAQNGVLGAMSQVQRRAASRRAS